MSRDLTNEAVERAVRFQDIKDRAQRVTPVAHAKDILAGIDGDGNRIVIPMPYHGSNF